MFRPRPASYGLYALATILPALLAGAACHPVPPPSTPLARRGVPLPSARLVQADAPAGSGAPSFGEAVLTAANARAATASTCASGFADLAALRRAACSAPGAADAADAAASPAVDWDAFDAAYAAAGRRARQIEPTTVAPLGSDDADQDADEDADEDAVDTSDPLRVPSGCAFGCVPSKPSAASPLARVAAALPWGGKCFARVDARRSRAPLVAPTLPDGTTSATTRRVPLVAAVTNRIDGAAGEREAAPARAYFGASAFDGFPALVVDYRGQRRFGRFRDEVRHVGCGVWLGKTYVTDGAEASGGGDSETLAESLAAVGGVRLSPVVAAIAERAMPVRQPGAPPPHVLDFALFATTGEARGG